jgi:hypothetical protein
MKYFFSFFIFFLLLTTNKGATQKILGEIEKVWTQSAETDDKIAQSVKLMFETCEAKLGVFPALFGHEKISNWPSSEIQM